MSFRRNILLEREVKYTTAIICELCALDAVCHFYHIAVRFRWRDDTILNKKSPHEHFVEKNGALAKCNLSVILSMGNLLCIQRFLNFRINLCPVAVTNKINIVGIWYSFWIVHDFFNERNGNSYWCSPQI